MIFDALFVGIKEGTKLVLCILLVKSYLDGSGRSFLFRFVLAGAITVFAGSFFVFSMPVTQEIRDIVVKMTGYVFGLFYLFALGTLYQKTGTDLLGPSGRIVSGRLFLIPVTVLLTVLYFFPDMMGSSLYLAEMVSMSGNEYGVIFSAFLGLFIAVFGTCMLIKRLKVDVMKVFDLPRIILFLAMLKLFAGGVKGFAELSLIPSVQRGLMKLIHDLLHHILVTLMVPDHPILSTTTWNFIGFFFRETFTLWLSLIVMTVPLGLFLLKQLREEIQVPEGLETGAVRRKFIKSVLDDRVLRSVPVVVFIIFIAGTWFVEKGETGVTLFKPEPVPVIAGEEDIVIPIGSPAADLRDGMLHKYSLNLADETVRIIVMKKTDGSLSVCLDACEICPPDGYAQGQKHVVCLYCSTPIAIETLGKPGGCNPVPLDAIVTDTDVRISMDEIERKWKVVKQDKIREKVER